MQIKMQLNAATLQIGEIKMQGKYNVLHVS